jgi:uncharacterized protein (TIGR00299 family) protein
MKVAFFDCFSGIAGDMALGALLDCGVPLDELKKGLASLPVENWDILAEDVLRSGIHAKSISITHQGETDEEELARVLAHQKEHEAGHAHHHDHHHGHDHEHHSHDGHNHDEHSHDAHHHHDRSHDDEHGHHHDHHHHGRSMAEIKAIIEASALSDSVKSKALQIFEKIAAAEAYLHHSTPEQIHFHEIGGLDSLLDIVGVAWCLDYLQIERIYASPIPSSSGFVKCAHGLMPVPAPATLEMLKGATWFPTDIKGELVTPTGAGILAAFAYEFGPMPAMKLEKVGAGAGKKEFVDRPNMLRVSIGELAAPTIFPFDKELELSTLQLLETNIDDMNPQLFEAIFERCFAAGALDVWTTPIIMKKSRPAFVLSVLCEQPIQNDVLKAILTETTTLGVRISTLSRIALPREFSSVQTPYGPVKVKSAHWKAYGFSRVQPEWDDVLALSRTTGVSAREIYTSTLQAAQHHIDN